MDKAKVSEAVKQVRVALHEQESNLGVILRWGDITDNERDRITRAVNCLELAVCRLAYFNTPLASQPSPIADLL